MDFTISGLAEDFLCKCTTTECKCTYCVKFDKDFMAQLSYEKYLCEEEFEQYGVAICECSHCIQFRQSYAHVPEDDCGWMCNDATTCGCLTRYVEFDNIKYVNTTLENYIEVRAYAGETTLIIACGNKPRSNCGGYLMNTLEEVMEIHFEHSHEGCYTIDPYFLSNSSVIASFGLTTFSDIPSGSFDTIVCEGCWYFLKYDLAISEIVRVAKHVGAKLILDNGCRQPYGEFLIDEDFASNVAQFLVCDERDHMCELSCENDDA
jgi:hypothetical protein